MGGRGRNFEKKMSQEEAKKASGLGTAYRPFEKETPIKKASKDTAQNNLAAMNKLLGRRRQ